MIRPSEIVRDTFELCEHPNLVKVLGTNFETRFRELSKCVILENTRLPGLAVFRPELPKQFRALYFDVENDTPFVWSAFIYMFKEMKAQKVDFYTYGKEIGDRYRAVLLGATWRPNDGQWWWQATPDEFALALADRGETAKPRKRVAPEAPYPMGSETRLLLEGKDREFQDRAVANALKEAG